MVTKVYSAALQGVDARQVEVEVNSYNSDKFGINIVGLPHAAVRESSQRVLAAISNSALKIATGMHTVNLAPADIRKEGPSFDLPIAIALAAAGMQEDLRNADQYTLVGELALDGTIRPVKGILSIALEARELGRSRLIVPEENAREAAMVNGIEVYGLNNLHAAWRLMSDQEPMQPYQIDRNQVFTKQPHYQIDLADVKGQGQVKRALEVAAAGNHNLLFIGPPGTGKSMMAKRLPTILPPLTEKESIETTKIHSVAGHLDIKESLLTTRPFRAPHHTISDAGLLGGGTHPSSGEVSLSHNGILFLDELPEFRRQTLEVLRQPIEDKTVTISRAAGSLSFPSNFMMIAAMNPCPCGYYGDIKRECRCSPHQIENYRRKISGPLLDRIDLHVEVPLIEYKELKSKTKGENSQQVRERVLNARARQTKRFHQHKDIGNNSNIPNGLMDAYCEIDDTSSQLLEQAMNTLNFSARAHNRILKVARILADLADSSNIQTDHILEAIQYRTLDRKLLL